MAVIDRITGEARNVFDALPPHITAHIVEAMEANRHVELGTKQDVLRCWLEWEGIIGYDFYLMDIFEAMK